MDVNKYFGKKVIYDNYGQYIWAVESDGNHQKIADLRGWGAIQNLFKDNKGAIDFESAFAFQDRVGQFIVDAITEKLEKDAKTQS